jgi:hypothetical protein
MNPSTFSSKQQTILFLASNPDGLRQMGEESREIEESLGLSEYREWFNLEQRLAVRPKDIQRAFLKVSPSIVHFAGGGTGEDGLIFEDELGNPKLVDGAALAGLFALFADDIHCVVLNGCYSEVQAQAIAQHIEYVVGMRQEISANAAIKFAMGFYDALGAGRDIEFAFNLGRSAIQMQGIAEHLTPVLVKKSSFSIDSNKIDQDQYNYYTSGELSSVDPKYKDYTQQAPPPITHFSKADILKEFKAISAIGRNWIRTIDNESIPRNELSEILELIDDGHKTVLVLDSPGSGKTCLLLDLLEHYEKSKIHHVLFIRGDEFNGENGCQKLPEELKEKCEFLSNDSNVIIIIDSLDVLSAGRQHENLKFFLKLIDELIVLENVSIIVSCRTFDLDYDSHLSKRVWMHKVNLKPLDFDTVVSKFLRSWEIDPNQINDKMQNLLRLPQNLKMYGKLVKKGVVSESTSIYQLYEEFINELILRNHLLGENVIIELQAMADYLLEFKTWNYPKGKINCTNEILRELGSLEIILDENNSRLSFGHQTLAECLVVRSNLNKDVTFTEFITNLVQLPFIRPVVRAFLFYLRVNEPDKFNQQVRATLSSDQVTYHIKRLICESIAEIDPVDSDIRLVRYISEDHINLFGSFLQRLSSYEWFEFLERCWIPRAKSSPNKERLLRLFCGRLGVWKNQYPNKVIALWIDAFNSNWFDPTDLAIFVNQQLDGLQSLSIVEIKSLLLLIMKYLPKDKNYYFAPFLSEWVELSDSGDDVLWQYMTGLISDENANSFDISNKLMPTNANFHDKKFLENRLLRSNYLLDVVVNSIDRWSQNNIAKGIDCDFLDDSSFRLNYSSGNGYGHRVDTLTDLLEGIEKAFQHRCQTNDKWWQDNELRLRNTKHNCLRYFLIQAYKVGVQSNLDGIATQLLDKKLFESVRLNDELGKLMRLAYPELDASFAVENQAILNSLFDSFDEEIEFVNSVKYKLLVQIPIIFRTEETQNFLDIQGKIHECDFPAPMIQMSSYQGNCMSFNTYFIGEK